jgi:DNA-binding response OmpR family regulator
MISQAETREKTEEIKSIEKVEPLSGKKILLVDDDEEVNGFLKFVLDNHGALTSSFEDAHRALETFAEKNNYYNDYYDVIILDQNLRGRKGSDLAKDLKEKQPSIPIICITGLLTTEVENKEVFSAILQKPFQNYDDIIKTIQKLIYRDKDTQSVTSQKPFFQNYPDTVAKYDTAAPNLNNVE